MPSRLTKTRFKTICGILGISLLLFTCFVFAEIMSINKFGGFNTDEDPLVLQENRTPDSENVVTDEGQGLKPRKGFIKFSTESSRNLWSFYHSNGNKYLITQSSNVLKASLGGSTFDIYIGTVNPNVTTSVSALGDKFFYTNTTDGLKRWNTTLVEVVTGSYKAKYCVSHKGRLWLAGIVDDERTVYGSEYLDGENFTLATNPVETDPVRIQVQGALDDIVTGFFATFRDLLIWVKQRSFGSIYGTRRSNFGSREYSNNVGCQYPDSIKNCDGFLRWLGNDKVIYEFDGESYYPINTEIDTYMESIEQGDLNNRQWLQTSNDDWNSGTVGVGLDTTTTSGSIGFISQTATTSVSTFLSTSSDFRSGGTSDSIFVNYSTAMTGALATMFIPTCSLQLDKVNMSFAYKSNVAEGFQSWVTLHTGATCPVAVVLDTSTKHGYTTNTSGALTQVATSYFFTQSTTTDKRLTIGNTYWFVLHTTVTVPNTTLTWTTYTYTGAEQTFTPTGVTSMTVNLWGASGGSDDNGIQEGGKGAWIGSSITLVTGSSPLYIYIGGKGGDYTNGVGGWNEGGDAGNVPNNTGGGGGGATDIRIGGNTIYNRKIVAGAGGGAGFNIEFSVYGGSAGYITAQKGMDGSINAGIAGGGLGATQVTNGAGGNGIVDGGRGNFGSGGCGGGDTCGSYGGGGGSGWYGGGGGGYGTESGFTRVGAGGGGSSYLSESGTSVSQSSFSNIGNGSATIQCVQHAEFYALELQSVNLSSTTLLYTSSFTLAGSNYSTGLYDTAFEVFFATTVFTSTWTSKVFDAGTKMSEWNTFEVSETLNDGTIEYRIFSDTDTTIDINDSTTFIDSQTITDGQIPTIAVNRYITVSAKFQRSLSTYTPTLHSVIVNFNEGSSLRTFGEYIKQRYWLGVAVSSTANNKVLVYDRNKQWQRYSGINISAIVNFGGQYYFGNNEGIFIVEYGHDDNGSAINAYYKTKDYLLTNPDTYKQFDYLHLTAVNSSSTLTTKYYIDQHSTEYNLADYAMNTDLGLQNSRLPFPMDQIQQGKTISFKFSVSSIYDWRLLNFNLYYLSDIEPED